LVLVRLGRQISPRGWRRRGPPQILLFLKKKKQKDFCFVRHAVVNQRAPKSAKVFCFFFSKKKNLAGIWQRGRA
jgi:hypothetical protein